MKALVIGGTSGLGLELAKLLKDNHDEVVITGRTDPKQEGLKFAQLNIDSEQEFSLPLQWVVDDNAPFETVVYNPGFYQEGRISEPAQTEGPEGEPPAVMLAEVARQDRSPGPRCHLGRISCRRSSTSWC